MTLLLAILFQWASPSSSFIKIFFSFLENAQERGEENISFPAEIAFGFLSALCGERGKNFSKAENEKFLL